jgi:transcriptional regulator with XRE-family HTH domain
MFYQPRYTLCSMNTLAERVTEAVEAAKSHGYSVAQIAEACGITDKALYQWMDGTTKSIDGKNLVELAEISGYKAMWIIKEKGPRSDTKLVQQAVKLMEKMTPTRQSDAVKVITPLVERDNDDGEKVG